MAKHRVPDKKSLDPNRPMLFEIGRDCSLSEFYQLNNAALTDCASTQAKARAQIKKPGFFFRKWRLKKNAALEQTIEYAPRRAAGIRYGLQVGARDAFLNGKPEKIQAMMSEPATFVYSNDIEPHGEATYKADNIITLMYWSKTPAAVPAIALAKVAEREKQATLQYTLYRLISNHTKIEPLAFHLLQAGARTDGVILAEAVRKNVSLTLIEQILERGADFKTAFEVIKSNPGYFGDSAQKLAAIRDTLAQKNATRLPPPALLLENKLDLTSRIDPPKALVSFRAPSAAGKSFRLKI